MVTQFRHHTWTLFIACIALIVTGALFVTGTSHAQTTQGGIGCMQQPRLTIGAEARVTLYPDLPNRLRNAAGYTGQVTGQIQPGEVMTLIAGPVCIQGVYWWQVNHNGRIGWTAEGNGNQTYWLEPATTNPDRCAPQPRLMGATEGRVLPGLPNVLRTHPGTFESGVSYSEVIGEIPGGGEFVILEGPVCAPDGRFWWYVQYRNLIGWTAEGEGNTYWLEPVQSMAGNCEGALPSRLIAVQPAMVSLQPDLPNVLREQPGLGTPRVGSIPAGGYVQVLKGPHCADGYAWYMVQYRHMIGWTAESGKGLYWLIPR